MTERETINSLLEITKKEGGLLAAFEACGRIIEELKSENASLRYKNEDLEKKVAELEEKWAKVKGGRNEW